MKIKVAFILLGLDFSGAERVLVEYLKQNDLIEPSFYFIYQGCAASKFKQEFPSRLCKCLNLRYSKNALRFFPGVSATRVAQALMQELSADSVDIVYANNTLELGLISKFSLSTDIPVVGHIHDMRNSFGTYPKIRLVEKAIKSANIVLTVSRACADSWKNKKIQVVYNGISDFAEISKKRNKTLTFGFVGILCKRKGFDLFVKLALRKPGFHYKVAYNKIRKECAGDLMKLQACEHTEIFYDLNREQMNDFYGSIDVLVVPSRFDPFPTVILEAISRKILVIASNTDGIMEMVKNKALLFDKGNLEGLLARADLVAAMDDACKSEICEALSCDVRQRFSQNNKKKQINELLENLLRR